MFRERFALHFASMAMSGKHPLYVFMALQFFNGLYLDVPGKPADVPERTEPAGFRHPGKMIPGEQVFVFP